MSSLLVIFLLSYSGLISCNEDIITMFFKGYDKAIRPNFGKGKPTTIRANIYVESFGNIEEANMEYKVYTYFRQMWTDSRLAGKLKRTILIKGGDIDNIWIPDPYCYNARESNLMMPHEEINSYVKIEPSGEIVSSIGATFLASCIMNLQHFPLDSQTCHLKFGSYGYSTSDIIYEWTSDEVVVGNKELSQFEYKGAKLTSGTDVFTSGNFSTITVTFYFQRRIGYFLIQVYLPDIFVVMLSWIVFFMDKDDIGNRMALGITTILTIMFLLGSLNGNLPKVSYPKALDWYLLVSFSFVFLSLVECMIVYIFMKKATNDDHIIVKSDIPFSKRISSSVKSLIGSRTDVNSPTPGNIQNGKLNMGVDEDLEMVHRATKADKSVVEDGAKQESIKDERMERIAGSIDNFSRVLFPFAFVCYNIFYWAYY